MTSTPSSIKPAAPARLWGTIVLVFRKNLAIFVTVLILMLLALPLILLLLPIRSIDTTQLSEIFTVLTGIPLAIIAIVSLVLCAGQMFSYLHSQTAIDIYHALPLRRSALFGGRFLGGALMSLLPQAFAFAAVFLIRLLPGYQILDLGLAARTAGSFLLLSLALYSVSVLAFVLTGTTFDALFLLLLLNLLHPVSLYTIDFLVSSVLPGFSMNQHANVMQIDRYLVLSPLGKLLQVSLKSLALREVLWWIFLILVMSAGSLIIYQRRRSEMAGKPLAYRTPFLIVRGLVSLVVGLVFGSMYYDLYATCGAFIFSAVVGSLATHTLIEAVLSRGFRNFFRSLPSYGGMLVLAALGCLAVSLGFFGYDSRLPAEDRIVQVRFATSSEDLYFFANSTDSDLVFKDPDNIADFHAMHQAWLQKMQSLNRKPYTLNTNPALRQWAAEANAAPYRLTYVLASGAQMARTVYFNFDQEPYASLYGQIRGTAEYKQQQYRHLFYPDSELSGLSLYSKTGQISITIDKQTHAEGLAKILAALRQDLLVNAEKQTGSRFYGYLNVRVTFYTGGPVNQGYSSTSYHIPLSDAFASTLTILDELRLLDGLEDEWQQIAAMYITIGDSDPGKLLNLLKMRQRQGPFQWPVQDWTGGQLPSLLDEQIFAKIDDKASIQALYRAGQDAGAAADDAAATDAGYLLVLEYPDQIKSDGQVVEFAPVLYVPAAQMPHDVLEQLR